MTLLETDEQGFVRESVLQESVDGKVRCNICERRCLLVEGGTGWCRTRQNKGGTLVTLTYGAISSLSVNPIEKKPFYHFFPGTKTLTAGSWSCIFDCPWCQNWDISRVNPPFGGNYVSPQQFVAMAQRKGCQGTSISFNEPTLSLEWSLNAFRLSRPVGLYNTFVTNGYMTPEALDLLVEAGLDAMNVDVKGDAAVVQRFCRGVDVDKVWTNCKRGRSRGLHIEVTTLVIHGVNDQDDILQGIAQRLTRDLGPEIPWHLSGYLPAYKFTAPPTPISTLERAWRIGKDAGLQFVYLGNVPGHRYYNTYCPSCHAVLIERDGLELRRISIDRGCCPRCGRQIAGIWTSGEGKTSMRC
ncbi:MAG TPA: AmmeMemoRadiSam system radical SAM enzyme [Dongiaceae bacterium]|nr:AmmeMemoRadiSam system radical SAM enzyme [Dongiaceae bacterium]